MNSDKKKNNVSALSRFKSIELTKKELRTIDGGYTIVPTIGTPKLGGPRED